MPILTPVRGRLFVALLALAAALLLAAGCSNDSGGDKTPAAGQTPATGQTPAAGQTPSGGATAEIKMVAGTAFSTDELRIPANTPVTITADNTDGFHSFAVFESQDAAESGEDPIAETETCSAPCKRTVEVNLAAGEHFFRCQVHTTAMTGTITAE
jgi:plastocyanin